MFKTTLLLFIFDQLHIKNEFRIVYNDNITQIEGLKEPMRRLES